MVHNADQAYHATKHLHDQSNNNATSSVMEGLRLQQQSFRDEDDRLAEDASQMRVEDAQDLLRQHETLDATAVAPAAAPTQTSGSQPRVCTPQADPTDLFDIFGCVWCKFTNMLCDVTMLSIDTGEYHERYTPTHSTRYCNARQAHERRNANPDWSRAPWDSRLSALQILEELAFGRSSSSGGIQKRESKGKGKRKNKDKKRRFAAVVNKIAKLQAEKDSSKNLPVRGPLKKDSNDDEGGPDSGAPEQLTV